MHPELKTCRHVTVAGQLHGHTAPVTALAWSPDGRWLASCARNGTLNLWATIRSTTRPRFSFASPLSPAPGLTSVAWSHDGRYLACGTTAGWLDVWEMGAYRSVPHADQGARSAITCVAWSPPSGGEELRLAFGDSNGHIHFRNYDDWERPDVERGIGHQYPLTRIAWARDGSTAVSATRGGTIGVWTPSARDNELRVLLTVDGIRAHHGAVRCLAVSPEGRLIASGGADGVVRLWDLDAERQVEEIDLGEEVVDVQFAHGGKVLVVHSTDHMWFMRSLPLEPIETYYCPAALDPEATVAVNGQSQLATVDPDDRTSILVWQVDFDALLKLSTTTARIYRGAAVSLLGEPGSGRTNLALALSGQPFMAQTTVHDFRVHRMPVRIERDELHEVALWDLPTRTDHALVHRVHAGDGAVALLVLAPFPGTLVTAADNVEKWHHTLRRWNTLYRPHQHAAIVVITRCDELDRPPTPADAAVLCAALDVTRVVFTSAKSDAGIVELRQSIIDAVDWSRATAFPSVEVLTAMMTFVEAQRADGHFLTSTRELCQGFLQAHSYARKFVSSHDVFRNGVQLLEVLGALELFERRDEVVLDPAYYHAYASAMIAGAERDDKGMGRLPLRQAETGRGRQMLLPEGERIADPKQEARLLHLTIQELVACGVAQVVAADGVNHLVFPISVSTPRPAADARFPEAARCRFVGEAHQIYSSLVVRLLALENHYPQHQLWKNEARFTTAAGGGCEIGLSPTPLGDEAELVVAFAEGTHATERRQFTQMVRTHIRDQARSITGMEELAAAGTVAGAAAEALEVFLCWPSEPDAPTADNVRAVVEQLRVRGIATHGYDRERLPGETADDRLSVLQGSRVALLMLSGPMDRRQEIEYRRLVAAGCDIIPVLLPNAKRTVAVPPELRNTVGADYRERFLLDVEPLARGIAERLRRRSLPSARPSVFLSYSRTDHALVSRLRDDIQAAGHRVWWDGEEAELPPGTLWQDRIRAAIRDSYAFIWCLSEISALRSQSWMYPEVLEAIAIQQTLHPSRVFIIPVRLTECDVPDLRIDAVRSLSHLQRFDYFGRSRITELVGVLDDARQQVLADLRASPVPAAVAKSSA